MVYPYILCRRKRFLFSFELRIRGFKKEGPIWNLRVYFGVWFGLGVRRWVLGVGDIRIYNRRPIVIYDISIHPLFYIGIVPVDGYQRTWYIVTLQVLI